MSIILAWTSLLLNSSNKGAENDVNTDKRNVLTLHDANNTTMDIANIDITNIATNCQNYSKASSTQVKTIVQTHLHDLHFGLKGTP